MVRKPFWSAAVLLLGASALALTVGTTAAGGTGGTESANLAALHDPQSPRYDRKCLKCHRSVLKETTQDPRTPSFHKAMMPYTPGYNPARGPNNRVCIQCHRYVEVREDSAGSLRKHVNPQLCAMCHGPSGPGPKFYQR